MFHPFNALYRNTIFCMKLNIMPSNFCLIIIQFHSNFRDLKLKMKIQRICPSNHIKAIIISRYITIKRSWKSILLSILGTCISSCAGVAFYWILFGWINPPIAPISYQSYGKEFQYFAFVGDSSNEHASYLEDSLKQLFLRDTKKDPTFLYFKTLNEMQNYIYDHYELNIIFGLDLISYIYTIIDLSNTDRY